MVNINGGKVFTATSSASAPNNSIFLDSSDNIIKVKDNSSAVQNVINTDIGEIKQFALSLTGAVTKSSLQAKGWAICDGTTASSQGISGATITTTPDLQYKFIRMSNDETSGTTGGKASISFNHTTNTSGSSAGNAIDTIDGTVGTGSFDNQPPYYELVFFIKVK